MVNKVEWLNSQRDRLKIGRGHRQTSQNVTPLRGGGGAVGSGRRSRIPLEGNITLSNLMVQKTRLARLR